MSYQEEQDRIFDEIELRAGLAAALERREDLAREYRESGAAIDEKALKKLKKVGRAAGIDDEIFMERLMRALIDHHNQKQSEPGTP